MFIKWEEGIICHLPEMIIGIGEVRTVSTPKYFLWFFDNFHTLRSQYSDNFIHFRFALGIVCQGKPGKLMPLWTYKCIFCQFFSRKKCQYNTTGLEKCDSFLGSGYLPTQRFCIELFRCLKIPYAQGDNM